MGLQEGEEAWPLDPQHTGWHGAAGEGPRRGEAGMAPGVLGPLPWGCLGWARRCP